ncbi:MAG: PD40 domain-containing protein [Anaerolineae bacterium]|nr:PD40 domain-containing protein [Anaerolineae bacterium]
MNKVTGLSAFLLAVVLLIFAVANSEEISIAASNTASPSPTFSYPVINAMNARDLVPLTSIVSPSEMNNDFFSVAWSANGEVVAIVRERGIYLHNATNLVDSFQVIPIFTRYMYLSANGALLAFSVSNSGEMYLYKTATGDILLTLNKVSEFAFSPDGKILAVIKSSAGMIELYDTQTVSPKLTIKGNGWQRFLAFSPDSTTLATIETDEANHINDTIKLWDVKLGTEQAKLEKWNVSPTTIRFSPDGKWIAATYQDARIIVWDIMYGTSYREFSVDFTYAILDFSPDSRKLVAFAPSGVHLFSLDSNRYTIVANDLDGNRYGGMFSQSNDLLIYWDQDDRGNPPRRGRIRLWDVDTEQEIRLISSDYRPSLSPDGRILLSVDSYKISIWVVQ